MILRNFNTHLELTLLSNPELMSKYPQYKQIMTHFMNKIGISPVCLNLPQVSQTDLTLRYSNGPGDKGIEDLEQ
jgi:hypothetical protein